MAFVRLMPAALLGLCLPGAPLAGQEHREVPAARVALNFVVMGDPQPEEPPTEEPAVFRRILREVASLRPDAVVLLGDLIRGFTADTQMVRREWEAYEAAVAGVRAPVLRAPGNHDVWDSVSQRAYAGRFGTLYGSCTVGQVHFIMLNSYELGGYNRIGPAQLAWLAGDLEAHREARHIFVGVHAPLWAYGSASNWMSDVHPLLLRYNARAVFAGHWHIYQRDIVDGIRYFVTGGAGGLQAERSEATGEFHHYLYVTVRDDSVSYALVMPGAIQEDGFVTRQGAQTAMTLRDDVLGDPRVEARDSAVVSRTVTVSVANPFGRPLRGSLSWILPRPVIALDRYERELVVAPGGRTDVVFRLEAARGTREIQAHPPILRAALEVQDSIPPVTLEKELVVVRTATARRATPALTVDGDLREWGDSWPVEVTRREQVTLVPERWSGPAETSGEFAVALGDSELFFAGKVRDRAVFHATRREEPYQADAVTLYLDLRREPEFQKRMFARDVYCIVFAPPSDAGEDGYWVSVYPYDRRLRGVRFASRRAPGGYTVEAAVPLRELSPLHRGGGPLGLDVCIDNLDASGNRTRMAWNGIWANFMHGNRYGRLRLP